MNQDQSIVPWWRVQFTEDEALSAANAIRQERLSLGPLTAEFEAKLADKLLVPYVVATTSGSTALLMALIAIGVGPGDEVIIPNRTWIAAAHAVMMLGAKVVLVDVCADIPNINTDQIRAKINARTKAIIPTALNGRAVDMKSINSLAAEYGLCVIEDAAQALFSRSDDVFIGTQSPINCFSLSVAKLIPTGQGGFLTTNDKKIYQDLRKIRTHGVDDLFSCNFTRFGFNFRFTDLQASIGLTQLLKLDQKIKSLNRIYYQYEIGLKTCSRVRLIPVAVSKGELPLYIEVLCSHRDELMEFLDSRHIQYKAFYPNLNRAAYFDCGDSFPNANVFETRGLTLPCGPDQSPESIDRVIQAIHEFEHEPLHNQQNSECPVTA